jgi:hypothetical protein
MKQEEAMRLIIQEWDRWIQTQSIDSTAASGRDSLKFLSGAAGCTVSAVGFSGKRP